MTLLVNSGVTTGAAVLGNLALGNPIGAAGAAFGGAAGYILSYPVKVITEKVFNTDKENASQISKVVQTVAVFFATAGIYMAVGAIIGNPITLGTACALAGLTTLISLGIILTAGLIWKANVTSEMENGLG